MNKFAANNPFGLNELACQTLQKKKDKNKSKTGRICLTVDDSDRIYELSKNTPRNSKRRAGRDLKLKYKPLCAQIYFLEAEKLLV